jgi:UDP-N-acetylmuramoylalanine--D-glutamate ligase
MANDWKGRRATVMGLGLFGGGAAAARYLARAGAHVTITDKRTREELAPAIAQLDGLPIELALGGHAAAHFDGADLVVLNPAVDPRNEWVQYARSRGSLVTSEVALFLERCTARVHCVTGTQGKSSTSTMLHQLLAGSGLVAHLGGNIGRSLVESAEQIGEDERVVLELSSYQLESLTDQLAHLATPPRVESVACVNVLPDHLDRHGSFEQYAKAKERILDLVDATGGHAVLPAEDPTTRAWTRPHAKRVDAWFEASTDRGLNMRGGEFRLDREVLGRVEDLRIPGAFQRRNALVALGMARLAGVPAERLAALVGDLRAPSHRLEDLGLRGGHRVWDNGVSTTPDSTLAVYESLSSPVCLLVGGKSKDLPLEALASLAKGKVARVVAFGHAGAVLRDAFHAEGIEAVAVPTVRAAVAEAYARMQPGEELLFSPACASFDAYKNFKERAEDFRQALPAADAGDGA